MIVLKRAMMRPGNDTDAIMARYYLLKGNYRSVIGRTKVSAADTCKLRAEVTAAILAALHR